MKFEIQKEDIQALSIIKQRVEDNSSQLDEIVNNITSPYTKDLDDYVFFIKDCLKDGTNPPTIGELEDFCMNLATYIYFAGGMCENLGIRDDIAKAVYKEVYNSSRNSVSSGTVQDKNSMAELHSQEEYLISSAYNRSYKIVKSKVDNAQELLQSCKKVLSNRISERELTRLNG